MEQLVSLIPVVLGAVLALSGSLVAQLVTDRLTQSREVLALRRKKAEALVRALYGHMQWVEDKRNVMVMKLNDHDAPDPLDEARMLQRLYFPELSAEVGGVLAANVPMLGFLHRQHLDRLRDEQKWMAAWNTDEYARFYKTLHDAVDAATAKCRDVLGS